MGNLIHPSCTYAIWSPSDTELEYNSKYQALQSQSSLHKHKIINWQKMYPLLKLWDCVIVYSERHEIVCFMSGVGMTT